MKDRNFEEMSLDDLWGLHEAIVGILDRRLEEEKHKLQQKLDELGVKTPQSSSSSRQRRPYPKVEPKFQNPHNPTETWSGRGKQPRWIIQHLKSGKKLDELRIKKIESRR